MELLGFILAFVVGIVMGIIGAGGSILSSGLLVYVFGLNPVVSASYTLLNVGAISLVGSVQYFRKNLVDIRTGLLFSVPALVTVLAMRRVVMPAIPPVIFRYNGVMLSKDVVVMLVFATLMIVIAWNMLTQRPPITDEKRKTERKKFAVAGTGMAVGILTGIVGVGGGFMIVPALFLFTGLNMKTAVGTSLFVITINTTAGFLGDFSAGICYNWEFLSKFILVTVGGMLTSSLLVQRIRANRLKKLFAIVILCLGCWIIVKEILLDQKLVQHQVSENSAPIFQPRGALLWYD